MQQKNCTEGKFTGERKGGERKHEPGDQERLRQAVKHIDNEIVIRNRVDIRTWKLAIDQYTLHQIKIVTYRLALDPLQSNHFPNKRKKNRFNSTK